ncbi:hypothetical protein O3M35_007809 [Rhynocoris fuscipes]|uniref:Uncharacterized protein n=1 Tax=Rhynocoris fuscipes TaxID=488301 RepID=A0AAW1DC95_9HEMI
MVVFSLVSELYPYKEYDDITYDDEAKIVYLNMCTRSCVGLIRFFYFHFISEICIRKSCKYS